MFDDEDHDDLLGTRAEIPLADEVAERMAEPGALRASLSLYRANLPPEVLVSPPLQLPPITCPMLGILCTRAAEPGDREVLVERECLVHPEPDHHRPAPAVHDREVLAGEGRS